MEPGKPEQQISTDLLGAVLGGRPEFYQSSAFPATYNDTSLL